MVTEFHPVYSPRFEVTIGGTRYQEVDGLVRDVVVENTIDGADLCTFTLNHAFDLSREDFAELNWDDIEPGTDLEVSVGWGGKGSIEPVFVGTSHSIQTEFSTDMGASIAVSGYGPLHQMMRGVVERSWSDTSVVDVAQEILNEYFSNVTVEGNASQRNRIIQHNRNDYRFLRELAEEYGFEFYADMDTVYFTPRDTIRTEDPDTTLTYGNTLDTFDAEITTANQLRSVEVRYWDMQQEKAIVGTAEQDEGEGKEVFRIACDSQEEADDIAASKLSSSTMERADGTGETDGIPALTPGTVIRLEGLGKRFTSNYYVTRVTHRIGGSGYRTSFDVTELPS